MQKINNLIIPAKMSVIYRNIKLLLQFALVWSLHAEDNPRIEVAIINMVPFHHEVYPALHHAWVHAGYDVTSYVNGGVDSQMTTVTMNWGFTFQNITEFPSKFCKYKVMIFASVEYYRDFRMASRLVPNACRERMKYVFVVHNPGAMRDSRRGPSRLLPLVTMNQNVHVVGLSPHTSNAISKILKDNGYNKSVDYIIPLFPIDIDAKSEVHAGFALQGSISDRRRNYKKLIEYIAQDTEVWPADFNLFVLGKGSVEIPVKAERFVKLLPDLAYPEYYRTIQQSYGVLTAFASQIYYREKSSSTVAASLICGTPLLTEKETLHVYSYISESSVWLRDKSETDIDAMHRILNMDNLNEEYMKRYQSLQTDIENAHIRNTITIDRIMSNLMSQ